MSQDESKKKLLELSKESDNPLFLKDYQDWVYGFRKKYTGYDWDTREQIFDFECSVMKDFLEFVESTYDPYSLKNYTLSNIVTVNHESEFISCGKVINTMDLIEKIQLLDTELYKDSLYAIDLFERLYVHQSIGSDYFFSFSSDSIEMIEEYIRRYGRHNIDFFRAFDIMPLFLKKYQTLLKIALFDDPVLENNVVETVNKSTPQENQVYEKLSVFENLVAEDLLNRNSNNTYTVLTKIQVLFDRIIMLTPDIKIGLLKKYLINEKTGKTYSESYIEQQFSNVKGSSE